MLTIIAAVGWILFLLTAYLYLVAAVERQALAVYSLAALLSDEFRTVEGTEFENLIRDTKAKMPKNLSAKTLTWD